MHFYQNDHLATELSDIGTRHILWSQAIAMVQLEQAKAAKVLQVDQTNSVLGIPPKSMAYSPYGQFEVSNSTALVAFNGQRLDLLIDGYALGNGYRIYRPNLRRFCSPDTFSPFSNGGLNAYSYCEGDPINNTDPSGHSLLPNVKSWLYRHVPGGTQSYIGRKNSQLPQVSTEINSQVSTSTTRTPPPYSQLPSQNERRVRFENQDRIKRQEPPPAYVASSKKQKALDNERIRTAIENNTVHDTMRQDIRDANANLQRVLKTRRILESRGMTVPQSYLETIEELRTFIRQAR